MALINDDEIKKVTGYCECNECNKTRERILKLITKETVKALQIKMEADQLTILHWNAVWQMCKYRNYGNHSCGQFIYWKQCNKANCPIFNKKY